MCPAQTDNFLTQVNFTKAKKVAIKNDYKSIKLKNKNTRKLNEVIRNILVVTDSVESNWSIRDTDGSYECEISECDIGEENVAYEIGVIFVIFIYEEEYFVGLISGPI